MNRPTTRQERRKQRTRQQLLDAARRVIARRGYEATGVLDITEAADVSKGTFYLYFKDKEDLTRTLILEGLGELRARVDAVMSGEPHPGQMAEALRAVFHYAANNRDQYRIMLGRQASPELNLLALNYFTDMTEVLLTQASAMTGMPAHLPALLAQFIAGATVRLGLWWLEDDHGLSPDDIADIATRLLNEGVFSLLPPEVRPRPAAGS